MANKWYFARDSKTYGPYSAGQLRGLAAAGHLRPRDAVWKEGMENRVEAARVKDLFTAAQLHAPAAGGGRATPAPSPRPAAPAVEATPPSGAVMEAAPDPGPGDIPDDVGLVPLEGSSGSTGVGGAPNVSAAPEEPTGPVRGASPPPAHPEAERRPPQQEVKKRRVLSVKGADLLSQDGTVVRFRKKCGKCGRQDTSVTTMQIQPGCSRANFFCPKCRKSQPVEVQGVIA